MKWMFLTPALISALAGIAALACLVRRLFNWSAALGLGAVGSVVLGYLAATKSDPPSVLPGCGWIAGFIAGALLGVGLRHVIATLSGGKGGR